MAERAEALKKYLLGEIQNPLRPEFFIGWVNGQINHLVDKKNGVENREDEHHDEKDVLSAIRDSIRSFAAFRGSRQGEPFGIHKEYIRDSLYLAKILGDEEEQADTLGLAVMLRTFIFHLEHQQACTNQERCTNAAYHEEEPILRAAIFNGILLLSGTREKLLTTERITS